MPTIEHLIDLGGDAHAPFRILAPADARERVRRALTERARTGATPGIDGALPFWGRVWPSAIALARCLVREDLSGLRAIELGAGLGLVGLAAARAGANVLVTDREPEALDLAARSATLNGLVVDTADLDWNDPGAVGRFDLVLASDVLLEPETATPLAGAIAQLLRDDGRARIADPWLPNHPALEQSLRERALTPTTEIEKLEHEGIDYVTVHLTARYC